MPSVRVGPRGYNVNNLRMHRLYSCFVVEKTYNCYSDFELCQGNLGHVTKPGNFPSL